METPGQSRLPIQPAALPRPGRLKSNLAILAVVAGIGGYWYMFPDGVLNAAIGATPSAAASTCLGLMKSPLCYVLGTSSTVAEATPFDVAERQSRIQALAAEFGMTGEISLAGAPHLTAEEDRAGYVHWLGHASEADFEAMLDNLGVEFAFGSFAGEEIVK